MTEKNSHISKAALALDYWLDRTVNVDVPDLWVEPFKKAGRSQVEIPFPTALLTRVESLSKGVANNKFRLTLAALLILVEKYAGSGRYCVSTPVPNTESRGPLFFVSSVQQDSTVKDLVEDLGAQLKNGLLHSDYDFTNFSAQFESRHGGNAPLEQIAFRVSSFNGEFSNELDSRLRISIESGSILVDYSQLDFSTTFAQQFIRHYFNILDQLIESSKTKILSLSVLSATERDEVVRLSNGPMMSWVGPRTLNALFEQTVENKPDDIAVVFNDRTLDYKTVNSLANQRARYLKHHLQIEGGQLVALLLPKSDHYIVWMIAVLKAGGAFLPIDPDYPAQRKEYLISNSAAAIVIGDGDTAMKLPETVRVVDVNSSFFNETPDGNLSLEHRPGDTAYIIYTSGSTGVPKGVIVSHNAITNTIYNSIREYGYTRKDAVFQFTSVSFDISLSDIFCALGVGATIVLVDKEKQRNADQLQHYASTNKATAVSINPSLLDVLAPDRLGFRMVNTGGEPANYGQAVRLSSSLRYFNSYGPTEASVCCSAFEVKPDFAESTYVPIGKPFANTEIYVVDPNGSLLPVGCVGEIVIGGEGLAKGYINNQELTEKCFVNHPFKKGERVYRSGDYGKYLPDGNLLFIGRRDEQVKIAGHRIELREIELVAESALPIDRAVATAIRSKAGQLHVVLYYTSSVAVSEVDVKAVLSKNMPMWMVPSFVIPIEEILRDAHGKIDVRRLPDPFTPSGAERLGASTLEEKKFLEIWKTILHRDEEFGINDSFFQLGGNSILATLMLSVVHKELNLAIDYTAFFKEPTISFLSRRLGIAPVSSGFEPIVPAPQAEYYELSYAQRRLWVLCQFEEDSIAYNMPLSFYFSGRFSLPDFDYTVQELVKRHESLRTIFVNVDGAPRQRILPTLKVPVEVVELSKIDEVERNIKLNEIFKSVAHKPFNLEKGPLIRFVLVMLGNDQYVLIFNIHHIVNDGWSHNIILKEVTTIYNSSLQKKPHALPERVVQYKDYAHWNREAFMNGRYDASERYWLDKFRDKPNGVHLPFDRPRQTIQTFNGGRIPFYIPKEDTALLRAITNDCGATFFMGLLSLIDIILYKYSGQTDIIIGSPIAGRRHPDLYDMIGFLANTIVYRVNVDPESSWLELLRSVRKDSLDTYEHQEYPFDVLVEKLNLDRDLSQSPLFNVMVAHNNTASASPPQQLSEIRSDNVTLDEDFNIAKFDLVFFLDDGGDYVYGELEYNSDLFNRRTAQRIVNNFLALLKSAVNEPNCQVYRLRMIDAPEINRLESFSKPVSTTPSFKSIQSFFERQAVVSGDAIAVEQGGRSLTYRKLDESSNRIAKYLRESKGIGRGDIVGVCLQRSLEMIEVMMGIAKAGAAYLAVDPAYPVHRVNYMLNDAKAAFVISDGAYDELFGDFQGTKYNYALDIAPAIEGLSSMGLEDVNEPDDIIYIIYTSGTTGMPNGAMLSHGLLSNLVQWQLTQSGINNGLSCLQFTSINFCVSFQEIFITLAAGGTVKLIGELERKDIDYLKDTIEKEKIENVYLPFSYLNFLLNENHQWKKGSHAIKNIITAGEQLKVSRGLRMFLNENPDVKLHNHYGSSEMHVVTSLTLDHSNLDKYSVPPAGIPIDNTRIIILDNHQQLVPLGVFGELYVQGAYAVPGYVNNPVLTNKKIVSVPDFDGTFYRTGDVGRWLEDGTIELSGRKDSQLKIRGFRVELGEVEARILSFEGVAETVVVAKKDSRNHDILVAYVVLERGSKGQLLSYLQNHLPYFMVPHIVVLPRLPLMLNGKVDRAALPPVDLRGEAEYKAPSTEMEMVIVGIWEDILDRHQIGVNDNFFELGGHSLKATQVITRLFQKTSIKIELRTIFANPTVAALAASIAVSGKAYDPLENIPLAPPANRYVLSHGQYRLFILDQLNPGNLSYNMPSSYLIKGDVDVDLFRKAFRSLLERHEVLRTRFFFDNDAPWQEIMEIDSPTFSVRYFDWRTEGNRDFEIQSLAASEAGYRFVLAEGGLIRVTLVRMEDQVFALMLTMHHIITDGWSMRVLIGDLLSFYRSFKGEAVPSLKPLTFQYKDYAVWQRSQNADDRGRRFWLAQFEDEVPLLNLPTDFIRPPVHSYRGESISIDIPSHTVRALKELIKKNDASTFMVVVALVNVLLSKYSGQNDIVVGTPVAGRDRLDLEDQVGFYVNTLAIRSRVPAEETFSKFLSDTKRLVLDIFSHQSYPFDKLVSELDLAKDMARSPIFDVFVTAGTIDKERQGGEAFFDVVELGQSLPVSKFDLSFYFNESDDAFSLGIEYSTDLFRRSTIQRLGDHLTQLVAEIAAYPEKPISRLSIISTSEREELIHSFNNLDVAFPSTKLIHNIVEEQTVRTPTALALCDSKGAWTYRRVDATANQIASCLMKEYSVVPGQYIGLLMGRSADAIVSIIAILKCGCSYVPIDPEYPVARVKYIIEDASVLLVICSASVTQWDLAGAQCLLFDEIQYSLYPQDNVHVLRKPSDPAYVIYTSGSTGDPKGVVVTHRNVVRLIMNDAFPYDFGESDRWLLFHSLSFDVSVWEIFGALFKGGCLFIASTDILHSPLRLYHFIVENGITILNQVPSVFYTFQAEVRSQERMDHQLRYILFAGEALNPVLVRWWKEHFPATRMINMYGITETTVHVSFKEVDEAMVDNGESNIGLPMPTQSIYLVDEFLNLVPFGVVGEIVVGGEGVASGYLGKNELTKSRFVANHFLNDGSMMYLSGDLARRLPDGQVIYVGRRDHQVKVHGYRIECSEIENALTKIGASQALVVAVRKGESDSFLAAYLTGFTKASVPFLKEALGASLPAYMVPTSFIFLEAFPYNSNGKIDRKRLPEPVAGFESYLAPETEVEKRLADIWRQSLQVERVGQNDNFFDLGGHSLKAVSILGRIAREFKVNVSLKDIFSNPSLAGLALLIENRTISTQVQISRAPAMEYYPLSNAQLRLWLEHNKVLNSYTYNVPELYTHHGSLDLNVLQSAFHRLIQKYEILRTRFVDVNGEPRQQVMPFQESIYPIAHFDLTDEPDKEKLLADILERESTFVFDLARLPLVRLTVVKTATEETSLIINLHHIITDEWSMRIIVEELTRCYGELLLNPLFSPIELAIQYKDIAYWQTLGISSGYFHKSKEFWQNRFATSVPALDLPTEYRIEANQLVGDSVAINLGEVVTEGIRRVAVNHKVSVFNALFASVNLLLYKYSGQNDIVVGTLSAGRDQYEFQDQIGFFVNTLPIRSDVRGNLSFVELLLQVADEVTSCIEHQSYPYDLIIKEVNDIHGRSTQLFNVIVSYSNLGLTQAKNNGQDGESSPRETLPHGGEMFTHFQTSSAQAVKFDITFGFVETVNDIRVAIEYRKGMFSENTIKQMIEHFRTICSVIVNRETILVSEIDLVGDEERKTILSLNPKRQPVELPMLHELFSRAAKVYDSNTALVFGEQVLTYREVDELSTRLANKLRIRLRIQPDDVVGIMMDRCPDMIVGLFGIMKSGAAWLPIEPDYPDDRINYMLADSNAKGLLTSTAFAASHQITATNDIVYVDERNSEVEDSNDSQVEVSPSNLCYVLYTSGSTGKPKGVMVEHHSVSNVLHHLSLRYPLGELDSVLLKTSYSFDAAVDDLFRVILSGGKLVMMKKGEERDPWTLANYILKYAITSIYFVPSHLRIVLDTLQENGIELGAFKYIFNGGEAITVDLAKRVLDCGGNMKYVNLYGPTEATVDSTIYELKPNDANLLRIPIGTAITNASVYVLDSSDRVLPRMVKGEICIAGEGLARGYMNNDALTADRFVVNKVTGERMYRTGDVGRWSFNGQLEFLGRMDHQVKIRGYRVELGEVERAIASLPEVAHAIVMTKDDGDEKQLVCVVKVNGKLDIPQLKKSLLAMLPVHMIPARYFQIDEFPVLPGGKVDRNALQHIDILEFNDAAYDAPETELEIKLADVWSSVLGREKIGVTDDFFEMGGDSFKAMKVSIGIRQQIGRAISLDLLFRYPTIRRLAIELEYNQAKQQSFFPFTQIKEEARGTVLFVSPLIASVTIYNALARQLGTLGFDCYALQYKASMVIPHAFMEIVNEHAGLRFEPFAYRNSVEKSVEAMARTLMSDIRSIKITREIVLVGYSFGGLVCFELAKLIEKELGITPKLAVIDTSINTNKTVTDVASLNQFFSYELQKVGISSSPAIRSKLEELYKGYFSGIRKYKASGKINSRILAIQAVNEYTNADMIRWGKLTSQFDGVEFMDSQHLGMMDHVDEITSIMAQWLLVDTSNLVYKH